MTPDIDADLRHRRNGAGMNPSRIGAGAVYIVKFPPERPEQPFGHLRPGSVVRAHEENPFFPLILRFCIFFHHSDSLDVYMKMFLFIFIITLCPRKRVHGG
jgi:hypothetical protein